MIKTAGVLKGLMTGLLGVGEITGENLARQAGKGVRRAVAPAAAAGGTAVLIKKKEHQGEEEKTAFWTGFEKSAAVFNIPHNSAHGVAATQDKLRHLLKKQKRVG